MDRATTSEAPERSDWVRWVPAKTLFPDGTKECASMIAVSRLAGAIYSALNGA